jgi:hypothetical protein
MTFERSAGVGERMNNHGAFDVGLLHLLNQTNHCVSLTGRSQFRGTRGGKSAIGAIAG